MALDVGWITSGVQNENLSRLVVQLAMMPGSVTNKIKTGLIPTDGAADITTVSEMVCEIAEFGGWIAGTTAADQGGYPVLLRIPEQLTFDNGEPGVIRNDRVVGRIYDNNYDALGFYKGEVEILKGNTVTGAATALDASSIPLWKVPVPVGASVGTGGIDFGDAVDEREYTVAVGGILPVLNATKRDLELPSPMLGQVVYNQATRNLEIKDASGWQRGGIPIFSTPVAGETGARTGDMWFALSDQRLYYWDGTQRRVYGPNQKYTQSKLAGSLSYATNNAWVSYSSLDWPTVSLPGVQIGDQIEVCLYAGLVANSSSVNIGVSWSMSGVGITDSDYSHELLHSPDSSAYGFTVGYYERKIYEATSAGTAVITPRTRTQNLSSATAAKGRLDARIIR